MSSRCEATSKPQFSWEVKAELSRRPSTETEVLQNRQKRRGSTSDDSYFGGKGAEGIWQWHINNTPPHRVRIVPFAGHCFLSRKMAGCEQIVLCDLDAEVIDWWRSSGQLPPNAVLHHGCGLELIRSTLSPGLSSLPAGSPETSLVANIVRNGDGISRESVFVYVDSPYHPDTRTSRHRYPFDMGAEQHSRMIEFLSQLDVPVMVCGYAHPEYNATFGDWIRKTQNAMTRGGPRTEVIWMNYQTTALHDYRWLGSNFRERDKLTRRERRMIAKLAGLPHMERQRFLSIVGTEFPEVADPVSLLTARGPGR